VNQLRDYKLKYIIVQTETDAVENNDLIMVFAINPILDLQKYINGMPNIKYSN
jgi:hypothetical protein